mmetsp:Transcript_20267/g.26236  ORF Transcript_20267/g.26236 Transcript_20267/m.26236 type:complete len:180 (-) Transcript_20267:1171-1710(-)|eukprot:CAMPEP_0197288758 /NCGR_PEP_ID=MMETSP0890-20130614/5927_1 /TAXON_ID=44058 ORGANISM="Aureoumbra lagunensis, Strain CCMP1510" /NCGR_SAMPLE_ID=MMETSP0890 /ASSEMBLY_ACC=CAM_ASM_000533 /LENGTH=179 /DNA_ID=CAMNT_0042759727 /DNA_START=82 /DNA_END=621 /DNA_ORIENTATION=+
MLRKVCLLLVAGASALAPSMNSRPSVQGRRQVVEQAVGVLGAVVLAPKPAFADGAVSAATVQRARGIYGGRIVALKSAVDKGDFDAILEEKNAFDLFNSGAYAIKGPVAKAQKEASIAATKEIFTAVSTKDKAGLSKAYSTFLKNADIDPTPVTVEKGQGYSSDYDWKVRTAKGAIYQR